MRNSILVGRPVARLAGLGLPFLLLLAAAAAEAKTLRWSSQGDRRPWIRTRRTRT